jgi:hypothetical protein
MECWSARRKEEIIEMQAMAMFSTLLDAHSSAIDLPYCYAAVHS